MFNLIYTIHFVKETKKYTVFLDSTCYDSNKLLLSEAAKKVDALIAEVLPGKPELVIDSNLEAWDFKKMLDDKYNCMYYGLCSGMGKREKTLYIQESEYQKEEDENAVPTNNEIIG